MPKTELKINLGPKYFQTQGLIKLVADCDAEKIKNLDVVIGYSHKGMEKIAEKLIYMQYLPLTVKISPLSGFAYQEAFCFGVEKLANIEVPEKAQYIRVLLMELERISSHLFCLGNILSVLGNLLPFNFCIEQQNLILNIFEKITGQRFSNNYYVFGGVKNDISNEILDEILLVVKYIFQQIETLKNFSVNNPLFVSRTKNIGIIHKDVALNFSITGVNLRASGVNADFRKKQPYLIYDKLDFEIPVEKNGDAYSRCVLRINEIEQSVKIVEQCVDKIKNTNSVVSCGCNQIEIITQEDTVNSYVESTNGLVVCTIFSDGTNKLQRVKWRVPSFYSIRLLPFILKNKYITDVSTIFGSLDINVSEADR